MIINYFEGLKNEREIERNTMKSIGEIRLLPTGVLYQIKYVMQWFVYRSIGYNFTISIYLPVLVEEFFFLGKQDI